MVGTAALRAAGRGRCWQQPGRPAGLVGPHAEAQGSAQVWSQVAPGPSRQTAGGP
jgi:hypothetical protein